MNNEIKDDDVVKELREALATAYQDAVERILSATPSPYIPAHKQEHERTKQVYRAHKRYGGPNGTI
jgi:hypothetical protein